MSTDSKLLTREQAAAYLSLKVQTLATWACTGRYDLPFIRLGSRAIRYRQADLDAFCRSRTVGAVGGAGGPE